MTTCPLKSQNSEVDIALILEGSYPYIFGGVSSWVHQIIQNFPQYTFALIFLGDSPENYKEGVRYELPPNVTLFQTYYLFNEVTPSPPSTLIGNEEGFESIKGIHDLIKCPSSASLDQIGDIYEIMEGKSGVDFKQFLYSERSWDYIVKEYTEQCGDSSFIDYYWTVKNIHYPLWQLMSVLKDFPRVKLVHTISTGYAGLLSFFIKKRFDYPVVLTEHGIYTKERKIDIFLSDVIHEDADRPLSESNYLRNLWDRYFKTLAQLTYTAANPIISLFKHAHQIQLDEGAAKDKTLIIPNGVNIERFKPLRTPMEDKLPVVCFIGRLVPMKDVKGFIRAIPNIHTALPEIKFWIIGSTDQDPYYAEECHELVENIGLQTVIEFKPHQMMEDILPKIKILVLSSIRESMPLVILESFAAGVPVVVTDVGACSDMVFGLTEEGDELGPAGKVVKVADPQELEKAIHEILADPALWKKMSASAIQRVERYYNETNMIEKYQQLYEKAMK